MSSDFSVCDSEHVPLPELIIHGAIHDRGSGLVLTCGRCGGEKPITHIASVKVYVQQMHLVIAFDLAALAKSGEYSLLCDDCVTAAKTPVPVVAG